MTSRRPRRAGRGFTLVELLVVIGIIAVLIAILLPTLARVRQQAITTQCAANLRTFGQAWQMYANANHGVCVPGRLPTSGAPGGVYSIGRSTEYRPHWYELLGAEVEQFANENPSNLEDDKWLIRKQLFLCGAIPDYSNNRNYVYGYNYQFLGNARHGGGAGVKWINYPVKSAGINAAQTVMAADSLGTAAGKPTADRTGYYLDGSKDPSAVLNKGWALDPPRMTADSDYADPQHRDPQDRSGPDARHQHRCNVVFCDGHVQLMSPQEMGYVVGGDGSMPVSGPGATNAMFSGNGQDADPPSVH
ncbi:MAG: N-terminal cleavage protein [Phycisphaerales bacterium]|nr:N-terminal cleavage protein [Phycisphaerales bacterium]